MKKLITICLLLITSITINAQDKKSTKEETIAFMNRTLKSTIGFEGLDGKIVEIDFNLNKYLLKTYFDIAGSGFYTSFIKSEFPWESLLINQFQVNENNLKIRFSRNYRFKYKIDNDTEKERLISSLDITLPLDKIESFKKACIRLSEIAKEEYIDPFEK